MQLPGSPAVLGLPGGKDRLMCRQCLGELFAFLCRDDAAALIEKAKLQRSHLSHFRRRK
jgi:hypothetical protein